MGQLVDGAKTNNNHVELVPRHVSAHLLLQLILIENRRDSQSSGSADSRALPTAGVALPIQRV